MMTDEEIAEALENLADVCYECGDARDGRES